MELEEELKVVGNSLKSLEVSEEKVRMEDFKRVICQPAERSTCWRNFILGFQLL
jgi:hypothetical protein